METRKFKIIKKLGNGHFGDVYEARDKALDSQCAIKLVQTLDPNDFLNQYREAQILEKCQHPNITKINEADTINIFCKDYIYFKMQLYPKGSIQSIIENGFLSTQSCIKYFRGALQGLEHAHNNGILHKDIKPGNILIDDHDSGILSDFGISQYLTEPPDFFSYTLHKAPEVLNGIDQNIQSDIYSAGITLYRLINNIYNMPPFLHDRSLLSEKVTKGIYPPRSYKAYIPKKIQQIVNRAINPNISIRFADSTAFRRKLEQLHFFIDWNLNDSNNWIGQDSDGNNYELIFIANGDKSSIVYKKNDRRKSDMCKTNLEEDEAVEYMEKIVSQTTLK